MSFVTAQDAEDAFYDAIEAGDARAMAGVWEDAPDIACLLPMAPLVMGPEVMTLWRTLFDQVGAFDIQVRHLAWIECAETAIHLVEERTQSQPGAQPPPPIYGTNIYRRGPDGWHLILHQNAPTPPPPGTPGF